MRVLVVEDSFTQAQIHRINLARSGFQVEWVATLQEVIDRLGSPGIDVVLLDLSLPDSLGISTFYKVREAAADAVPIVVISALDDEDVALEALKGGAQDYLIKGKASEEMLVRCLRHAIERNHVEEELRNSEFMMRAIIENSYDAFIAFDSDGEIKGWNRQAENTFGWERAEIVGQILVETIIPPRFKSAHLKDLHALVTTGRGRILNRRAEMFLLHKTGREVPVEIGLFPVELGETRIFCAFVHDITERKNIERRTKELNDELEKRVAERTAELVRSNAELHQFAKIASHDLQEPLRAIEGYANLLARRYKGKLDQDADEFIGFILDGTNRMVNLIQAVLSHARIGTSDLKTVQTVDCNEMMDEVLRNLRLTIEENDALVIVDDLPQVVANRTELVQLMQNLISNAIKYRGTEAPKIQISAEENVHEWVFSVRDNGIGIDPRYTEKIFDMFARLHGKTQYSGTGIGLAICKKIVETHGGRIWVESEPGNGSVFLFTLLRFKSHEEKGEGEVHGGEAHRNPVS
jgi:PAS domain S-box-containing protein